MTETIPKKFAEGDAIQELAKGLNATNACCNSFQKTIKDRSTSGNVD